MRAHCFSEHTVPEVIYNAEQRIEFQKPADITVQNFLWIVENRTGVHNKHQRNVPQIFHIPEINSYRRQYHTNANRQQKQI